MGQHGQNSSQQPQNGNQGNQSGQNPQSGNQGAQNGQQGQGSQGGQGNKGGQGTQPGQPGQPPQPTQPSQPSSWQFYELDAMLDNFIEMYKSDPDNEEWAGAMSVDSLVGYGCVGGLDMNAKARGKPVDELDRAIFAWRRCNRCANKETKQGQCGYKVNRNNECTNTVDSCGRYSCECDIALFGALKTIKYNDANANGSAVCEPALSGGDPACCKKGQLFRHYNRNSQSCCSDGTLADLGTC